jgi:type II secretory pathway pseudopilin PulG
MGVGADPRMKRRAARFVAQQDRRETRARGATLVELLVVIVVVATLAALVVVSLAHPSADASATTTLVQITVTRDAIVGDARSTLASGFRADLRALPRSLSDLLRVPPWIEASLSSFDSVKGIGWRGPYLRVPSAFYQLDPVNGFTADYGAPGDLAILDGFARPLVLQRPDPGADGVSPSDEAHARIVSAGEDGVVQTPHHVYFPPLEACGDDHVLYLLVADQRAP